MRRRQKVPTVDRRIAKALSHPLRSHLLGILNERVASPSEMAEELGESLQVVSYHCRTLLDLECIELVRTEPRRGALEHFYRAVVRPYFSDDDWSGCPRRPARRSLTSLFRWSGRTCPTRSRRARSTAATIAVSSAARWCSTTRAGES